MKKMVERKKERWRKKEERKKIEESTKTIEEIKKTIEERNKTTKERKKRTEEREKRIEERTKRRERKEGKCPSEYRYGLFAGGESPPKSPSWLPKCLTTMQPVTPSPDASGDFLQISSACISEINIHSLIHVSSNRNLRGRLYHVCQSIYMQNVQKHFTQLRNVFVDISYLINDDFELDQFRSAERTIGS